MYVPRISSRVLVQYRELRLCSECSNVSYIVKLLQYNSACRVPCSHVISNNGNAYPDLVPMVPGWSRLTIRVCSELPVSSLRSLIRLGVNTEQYEYG